MDRHSDRQPKAAASPRDCGMLRPGRATRDEIAAQLPIVGESISRQLYSLGLAPSQEGIRAASAQLRGIAAHLEHFRRALADAAHRNDQHE